mgnify:CR=1 FL=1
MPNLIDQAKPEFEKALEHFEKELKALRTGRAHAAMVEEIPVVAYDSTMALKGVASIAIPDAKTIQIEPWDKNLVKDIEKALQSSNLGITPSVMGTTIRLSLPTMTEENRKEFVRLARQKTEHARVGVRAVREAVREKIQAQEKAKAIAEDEKFRLQEQLDKAVGEFNERIEKLAKEKEQEIMTI